MTEHNQFKVVYLKVVYLIKNVLYTALVMMNTITNSPVTFLLPNKYAAIML